MSLTLRQQIEASISDSECRLEHLRAQSQPNQNAITGEERELGILKRKHDALPEDRSSTMRIAIYA